MFPDETSVWEVYPSILDEVVYPVAHLVRCGDGVLNLIFAGKQSETFAYALTASVRAFFVIDEFEYDVLDHGVHRSRNKGTPNLLRAVSSKLLDAYAQSPVAEMLPNVTHYALLSDGDCVEFLTQKPLTILALSSEDDFRKWTSNMTDDLVRDVERWVGNRRSI